MRSKEELVRLVASFIRGNGLGALAYVQQDGRPAAACVEFVVLEDQKLRLGFATSSQPPYLKHACLKHQPLVVITFWNVEQNKTVQCEGLSKEVEADSQVRTKVEQSFDDAKLFTRKEGAAFFEVELLWVRYSDFKDNREPFDIQEIQFLDA